MQFGNPFPGMNPYLERSDFHNALIAQLRGDMGPRLPVRYRIALEERIEWHRERVVPDALVIDESPAPETVPPEPTATLAAPSKGATAVRVPVPREIRVTWLRVEALPERDGVTVVEVSSPANKSPGRERQRHVRQREAIFADGVNLVEIDLLRPGNRCRWRLRSLPGTTAFSFSRPGEARMPSCIRSPSSRQSPNSPCLCYRRMNPWKWTLAPSSTTCTSVRVMARWPGITLPRSRSPARTAIRTGNPGLDREQGRNVSAGGVAKAMPVYVGCRKVPTTGTLNVQTV